MEASFATRSSKTLSPAATDSLIPTQVSMKKAETSAANSLITMDRASANIGDEEDSEDDVASLLLNPPMLRWL